MEDMVVAALVVGFARGITVVLVRRPDPRHPDLRGGLRARSTCRATWRPRACWLSRRVLNFFIPSGSGQAAVTMPLMAPLADVLGLTRQTAVFAFTCGDGFSNTVIPTSGILMAMLGLAKVPYDKWLRFMVPLLLQLLAVAAVFIAIAVAIDLQ